MFCIMFMHSLPFSWTFGPETVCLFSCFSDEYVPTTHNSSHLAIFATIVGNREKLRILGFQSSSHYYYGGKRDMRTVVFLAEIIPLLPSLLSSSVIVVIVQMRVDFQLTFPVSGSWYDLCGMNSRVWIKFILDMYLLCCFTTMIIAM